MSQAASGGATARKKIEFLFLVHGAIPNIDEKHFGIVEGGGGGRVGESFINYQNFAKADRFFKLPDNMRLNVYGEHQYMAVCAPRSEFFQSLMQNGIAPNDYLENMTREDQISLMPDWKSSVGVLKMQKPGDEMQNLSMLLEESKCCKQLMFGAWMCEATVEGDAYGVPCMLDLRSAGRGLEKDCEGLGDAIRKISDFGKHTQKLVPDVLAYLLYERTTLHDLIKWIILHYGDYDVTVSVHACQAHSAERAGAKRDRDREAYLSRITVIQERGRQATNGFLASKGLSIHRQNSRKGVKGLWAEPAHLGGKRRGSCKRRRRNRKTRRRKTNARY